MFQVGDTVIWTSQAGGTSKTKTGIIAEVVPPLAKPSREKFPFLYKANGLGLMPRKAISYVVLVGKHPYYPLTKNLRSEKMGRPLTNIGECSAQTKFYQRQCFRPAMVEREGRKYCTRHDPLAPKPLTVAMIRQRFAEIDGMSLCPDEKWKALREIIWSVK